MIGVEVPFDSVLHCRTSLRTGSSAALGMTDGVLRQQATEATNHEGTKAQRGTGKGTATDGGDRCPRPTVAGGKLLPNRKSDGRRAWECPPYNGRGKPLPNRTATARRAFAFGEVPALHLGAATADGDRCPRPTGRGRATADRLGTCPTKSGHGRRAFAFGEVPALHKRSAFAARRRLLGNESLRFGRDDKMGALTRGGAGGRGC